jgi:hypothetical protein
MKLPLNSRARLRSLECWTTSCGRVQQWKRVQVCAYHCPAGTAKWKALNKDVIALRAIHEHHIVLTLRATNVDKAKTL